VGLGANPIFRFGSEEQRQTWLPDLCAGRRLAAFGLSEPDAGSDAGGTRTTARLEGDEAGGEWVIDGEKAFITNSGTPITSLITVTARTGSGGGAAPEISSILVPAGAPGLTVQPPYRKMGWHASDTHGLSFADCRVPAANLLGGRGRGLRQFLQVLDEGRIAIAALAVGVIRCCAEAATAYAGERQAFGRPIGANQAVAFTCADLTVMAEAAGLLVYQAAWRRDTGRPFTREAAIAKLYASESAVTATRMATQVFGGYGFMDETPVSRQYRDAKILEIGEGTSEIQRLVIARDLGLPLA
jgi:alkylation response protein AidB-like acyl-CoA dehydrogenase